jgi:hypothetical protein
MLAETIMSHSTKEPSDYEKLGLASGLEPDFRNSRLPFDNSGLDQIPQPRSDDPPYRNWWVVETLDRREPRK